MSDLTFDSGRPPSARDVLRAARTSWWCLYGLSLAATLAVAYLAYKTSATYFSLALVILLMGVAVAIARPVLGLYIAVFFAVIGDPIVAPWYPATKNFSTAESLLFISDQIIVSPLEVMLAALLVGWLFRMVASGHYSIRKGRLFRPIMLFSLFVLFGLGYGLVRGGVTNVALWEARPLLYLPVVYVLVTNLLEERKQFVRLLWCALVATFINGVLGYRYLAELPSTVRATLETVVAHGATLPMGGMIMLIAAAWIFKDRSPARRFLLPILAVPVVIVYVESERRSAIVALIAAIIVLGIAVFRVNRRRFWYVAPVVVLVGGAYTAAFWNSDSSISVGARAVKSVIAPDSQSERDRSSDMYRDLETKNIVFTIRASPITGIGFGHAFYKPFPLPPINDFLLRDYLPHNSLLWVWMKVGVFGFVAMLYMFALAMREGARAVIRAPDAEDRTITFASTAFIVMYAVFAYVDIAWDPQNMLLLALAMAQIDATRWYRREGAAEPVASGQVEGAPSPTAGEPSEPLDQLVRA